VDSTEDYVVDCERDGHCDDEELRMIKVMCLMTKALGGTVRFEDGKFVHYRSNGECLDQQPLVAGCAECTRKLRRLTEEVFGVLN